MSGLVTVADRNMRAVEQLFSPLGEVRLVDGRSLQCSDLHDADVLLVRSVTPVNEALLADTPVRFVGTATSGFDHIDRDYLASAGIGFAHAPGSNATSVVEYVLAAIAHVDYYLEQLLAGTCVGVVGYGHVGKAVVAQLNALGVDCNVYDPWLEQSTVPGAASLEAVLQCRVICLHCELTGRQPHASRHMLGAEQLAAIAQGSLLINASRGEVIDTQALRAQLQAGRGPVTVLDVWEGEPAVDEVLLQAVRLGSAHIAGYSLDGKLRATQMLYTALGDHIDFAAQPAPVIDPAPALSVPAGLDDTASLRWLLQARYNVSEDDANLRAAVSGHSSAQAKANFDALRKHYAPRRELRGSPVSPGPHGEGSQWLAAFHCKTQEPTDA